MRGNRRYSIDIIGLKNGEHLFEYEIGEAFFQEFEQSPVEQGTLKVSAKLEKTERMLTLWLTLEGTVVLLCDRSNDPFDHPISATQKVVFKYGDEEKELGDEIFMIPFDTQKLELAQFIYEFIVLEIPMKKLHPRFLEDETYEDEIVYMAEEADEDNSGEEKVDPRWEALKKLKKDTE